MELIIQTGRDNEILRKKTEPIKKIDSSIKKLAKNMLQTLNTKKGLGLAAPQVGVSKKLIIVKINSGKKDESDLVMINPKILEFSKNKYFSEEGCLSLPTLYLQIERPREIVVKFLNLKGEEHILRFKDIDARIIQHEVDHLDGVLIVDKVEAAMPVLA